MVKIKNNKNLFQAVKNGIIKPKNNKFIRIILLKDFLKKNPYGSFKLCDEIVFSINYTVLERTKKRKDWKILSNCFSENYDLSDICLISNSVLNSFKDLQAIDFKNYLDTVQKYPKFKLKLYESFSNYI